MKKNVVTGHELYMVGLHGHFVNSKRFRNLDAKVLDTRQFRRFCAASKKRGVMVRNCLRVIELIDIT